MDFGKLARDALTIAEAVTPLVVPGASEEIATIAQAAISLVSNVKQDFSDPAKANETLAALQARVDAHVQATEQALGGGA